jgi:MFS family permease
VRRSEASSARSSGALGAYGLGAYGLGFHEIFTLVLVLRCADLDFSLQQVGLVIGIGSLTPALLAVPIGTWIDRFGARRSFVATSLATAALSLVFAAASSLLVLLLLQLVMGCTRTTAWVASQGYVTGISSAADRSTHAGRFGFFAGAGQALSAVMAGLVTEWGGTSAGFLLGAGYSLLFALIASRLPDLTSGARRAVPVGGFRQAGRLLRHPGVQTAMLMTFTRLWVVTAYSSFVPLLLVTGGLTPGLVGLVVAAKGLTATLLALATGPLSRRVGIVPLGVGSLAIGAIGLAVSPLLDGPVTAFVPAVLVGVAIGLSLPVILATLTVGTPSDSRALALSMRESINQVSSALAPPVVGRLVAIAGPLGGFIVTTCGCLGLLVLASLRHRHTPVTSSSDA